MTGRRPLDGIRVVSLADHYPGPFACMLLSDWGAEVINVERPGGDPARAFPAFHAALARGKRSVVLDLKQDTARAALLEMVRSADVVLEGYRPGVAARLGVDDANLRAVRSDLVYVSISGFGQDGPYRDRPAHDLNIEALAGLIALDPNASQLRTPQPPRLAVADLAAGHAAAQAVLLGLLRRVRDGEGSYVDVSMLDASLALLATDLVSAMDGDGSSGLEYEAGYGIFTCSDGLALSIGIANEDHFWQVLVDETGIDQRYRALTGAERVRSRFALQRQLAAAFTRRPRHEWTDRLLGRGLPVGAVQVLDEVAEDPQIAARGMVVASPDGDGRRFVRQPLSVDGHRWGPRSGVPTLGADTHDVLAEAGVAHPLIQQLSEQVAGETVARTR